MNFNYLMEKKSMKMFCKGRQGECYWSPTGPARATSGDNFNVTMFCKRCKSRQDIFLSREQYKIQENLIRKEVGDV